MIAAAGRRTARQKRVFAMSRNKQIKAVALISGGLDSILAARLVIDQGVKVFPLRIKLPYLPRERDKSGSRGRMISLLEEWAGMPSAEIDASAEAIAVLRSPEYGFGSNMNPCLDCRILMLKKGAEFMRQAGACFIVTGEVIGQRGMSQRRQALETADRASGIPGLILRPLSARLLPETIPEKEGWVERGKLLALSGRSRREQMRLAESLGIEEPVNAAGGCLLTDPIFSMRLRELESHEGLDGRGLELLKAGRHFRLSEKAKLIVGRDEKENRMLESFAGPEDILFYTLDVPGPAALGRGDFDDSLLSLSGSILAYYCRPAPGTGVEIYSRRLPGNIERRSYCLPADGKTLEMLRIGRK